MRQKRNFNARVIGPLEGNILHADLSYVQESRI
jgi:hypothetical protein